MKANIRPILPKKKSINDGIEPELYSAKYVSVDDAMRVVLELRRTRNNVDKAGYPKCIKDYSCKSTGQEIV